MGSPLVGFTGRRPPAGAFRLGAGLLALLVLLGSGCASLPRDVERVPSHAIAGFAATPLGRRVAAAQPRPDVSGFRLLPSGDTAFQVRLALADEAQRSLDLQYYAIERDPTTRELFAHIRRAARRGVHVRVLLDDLNTVSRDAALARLASRPNVEVRLFNPFPAGRSSVAARFLFAADDLRRLTRRMHNKLFVADNALAVVGGRNLGAAYFQRTGDVDFADLDVLVAGPAVRDLSRTFDRYWNSDLAYPVDALIEPAAGESAGEHGPAAAAATAARTPGERLADLRLVWAPGRVLADRPSKVASAGARPPELVVDDVLAIVRHARKTVVMVSPYFIPGPELTEVLRGLRSRGVAVRVLTNSLATTDMPGAHAAYARQRADLLALGVELYELRPVPGRGGGFLGSGSKSSKASLHAKVILVDGRWLFVGSMNLDPRSALENTETGLVIASTELGGHMARIFAQAIHPEASYALRLGADGRAIEWITRDDGGPRIYHHDPQAGFWRSLISVFLRVTVPDAIL